MPRVIIAKEYLDFLKKDGVDINPLLEREGFDLSKPITKTVIPPEERVEFLQDEEFVFRRQPDYQNGGYYLEVIRTREQK